MESNPKTVACIVGTRPEAIKMAPVILALRDRPWAKPRVIMTGQHRDLASPMLDFFGIKADSNLEVMRPDQDLNGLTSRLLDSLTGALRQESPDLVLAQGDTASVLGSALASYHLKIPFGHIEAGLRTGNLADPFPEEGYRRIAGQLATLHFAPTQASRENLIKEGIPPQKIQVTGNTVIDALRLAIQQPIALPTELKPHPSHRMILVTMHRRDNLGDPIRQVCQGIARLINQIPNIEFLWPVHPNPAVAPIVQAELGNLPRIHLCQPLNYGDFVAAMQQSHLILTDSGGIQEEASALNKPVLVLRKESERPEAIQAGIAKLIGSDPNQIVQAVSNLLNNPQAYQAMTPGHSPYGDGFAAQYVVDFIAKHLFPIPPA